MPTIKSKQTKSYIFHCADLALSLLISILDRSIYIRLFIMSIDSIKCNLNRKIKVNLPSPPIELISKPLFKDKKRAIPIQSYLKAGIAKSTLSQLESGRW